METAPGFRYPRRWAEWTIARRVSAKKQQVRERVSTVPVHRIDPLRDPRWAEFLERHPHASVFQTPGWLEALRRTYGYEPVALTASAQGEALSNGMVFCLVQSWLTGRRMVSLPFSDHCQPLAASEEDLEALLSAVEYELGPSKLAYIEIRPVDLPERARRRFEKAEAFYLHRLALSPSLEELFHGFHINCVQRKIRRAEREGLVTEEGTSETSLRKFYELHQVTRRRQRMPPQPLVWFRNLIACMGDKLQIRVTSKDGHPVASILTLRHKGTLVYKYGCLDKKFSNLGGMQLLLWKAIEQAKRDGLVEFDLGRSDVDNQGLIDFKRRWGAVPSEMVYLRYLTTRSRPRAVVLPMRLARQLSAVAPKGLVATVGRALYRHLG